MNSYVSKYFLICILLIIATAVYANDVRHINNQDLKLYMQQGVPVVDVRTTLEWQKTGIVEGSHLIMFYDEQGKYDLKDWLAKVAKVANKNEHVILICHSGSRSKQLANYLTKVVGYERVYNVKKALIIGLRRAIL